MKNANKTAKTVTAAKSATVAKPKTAAAKTETVKKPAAGKYGAPAVRPNRENKTAKSALGDRKWIFRGVTVINEKTLEISATDEKNSTAFPKPMAEKILAAALKNGAINGRLYFKKPVDGVDMRGVYVAYADDNGKIVKTA